MKHELALELAGTAKSTGSPTLFAGRWINQMNSSMELAINGQSVSGVYTSSSSVGGPAVSGNIIGYVEGDVISFSVLWAASGSITSWVGQLVERDGQPLLSTLWHLVTNVADQNEPTKLWTSTFAGADEFRR